MNSILFLFLFYFNLRLEFSVTSYVNITNCHVSVIYHGHMITYHMSYERI